MSDDRHPSKQMASLSEKLRSLITSEGRLCEVIPIQDGEAHAYHGAGLCIAQFKDATLTQILYAREAEVEPDPGQDDQADFALAAADLARQFAAGEGEYVMALASAYELCEPELFDANNPSHLARWTRLAFEAYLDEPLGTA